jgi:hypothetical protein
LLIINSNIRIYKYNCAHATDGNQTIEV